MTKQVCLFIGRFQPFHNGHLLVLKGMVKVCDRVIIGLGSSDDKSSKENPFTVSERREMIQRALQDENIIPLYDIDFVEIPDHPNDKEWALGCLELAKDITTVWTGNAQTKACFAQTSIPVQEIKEVPGISSTEIREKMIVGGDWKLQLPKAVVEVIIEIDGVERLKKL